MLNVFDFIFVSKKEIIPIVFDRNNFLISIYIIARLNFFCKSFTASAIIWANKKSRPLLCKGRDKI